jgi:signal transduction histidine kinase
MKSPAIKNIDMNSYGKLITGLVAAWFVFALSASALFWFKNDANRVGIAVAIAALVPILIFAVWFGASEKFRKFALSLDPQILTLAQTWRIVGFTFVLLEARGVLPAIFAWPAGYGDMTIGATATFAAWKLANPVRRNRFILWQLLGITDLGHCSGPGHDGRTAQPARPFDGRHDGVAVKPHSDVPGAAVLHPSSDLYRPGSGVEGCFRRQGGQRQSRAVLRNLRARERERIRAGSQSRKRMVSRKKKKITVSAIRQPTSFNFDIWTSSQHCFFAITTFAFGEEA